VRQFDGGLVELPLELLHLRATDAARQKLRAIAREASQAQRRVGHLPRLVEAADEPEQGDLFVERRQAAQFTELVKAGSGGEEVNFFAQGDCVVADDNAQGVVL